MHGRQDCRSLQQRCAGPCAPINHDCWIELMRQIREVTKGYSTRSTLAWLRDHVQCWALGESERARRLQFLCLEWYSATRTSYSTNHGCCATTSHLALGLQSGESSLVDRGRPCNRFGMRLLEHRIPCGRYTVCDQMASRADACWTRRPERGSKRSTFRPRPLSSSHHL